MPLTPGLSPSLRLVQSDPEPSEDDDSIIVLDADDPADQPEMDDKGNVIRIEHPDGSVTISLDGSPIADGNDSSGPEGWFDNLVEKIDQNELSRISEELLRAIGDDLTSRQEWIEDRAQGIRLLGLKLEIPQSGSSAETAPEGTMSRVRHPLMLEAVLRFQANARGEFLPTDGPVKIRNDNNFATPDDDSLATALEKDFNHYLTSVATEYYPDTDRMLLMTGFGGSGFKKIYFCPLRNRPVSESVDANDLIVNNAATDLKNAHRVTQRVMMKPSTVKRMQILEVYADIDLDTPLPENLDSVKREELSQQGVSAGIFNPDDRDREIYECYCELDLKGFEHKHKSKPSGLQIPYRVTIDVSSRQILSIIRNYNEDTKALPVARTTFVKYTYVPGFGFYDIGLVHILGNTTNSVTAAWRELLDAGMFANFPGFLISDQGGRQNTNSFRVPPGGGALVKTGGQPISQSIMPLPYKDPSPTLMALVENIVETGQRIGGTAELQVGEGRAEQPVGTTIALIEQAKAVLNSVHKRIHSAQAEEFQLLADCFREHPESFWQAKNRMAYPWDEATFRKALDNTLLVPQADPNTASYMQRVMKITALKQLQQLSPTLYDPLAVERAALHGLGWGNPDQFLLPPQAQGQMPPEMQQAIAELNIKKQQADATMLKAQSAAKESDARISSLQNGGDAGVNPAELQMKQQELQLRQQDQSFKQQRSGIEDENRDKDRQAEVAIEQARLVMEQMRDQRQQAHERVMQAADQQHQQASDARDMQIDVTKHNQQLQAQAQQANQQLQMDGQQHREKMQADQQKQHTQVAVDRQKHADELAAQQNSQAMQFGHQQRTQQQQIKADEAKQKRDLAARPKPTPGLGGGKKK